MAKFTKVNWIIRDNYCTTCNYQLNHIQNVSIFNFPLQKNSPCRVTWPSPHPPARSAVLPRSQVHVLLKRCWRCTQARNNELIICLKKKKVTSQITINVIINNLFNEQFHQCAINVYARISDFIWKNVGLNTLLC